MDIGFNVTMGCDKACDFCYLNLDGRDLDLETFVKALDSGPFERVTLSGGEPLSRGDIWDFLREAQSRELRVNLITNGTFLSQKVTDRLEEYEGLRIYVSYHRPNPELQAKMHYAHDTGISTNAHVLMDSAAYQRMGAILNDLSFVDSVMILYPTNTGDQSHVRMFTADEWIPMVQRVLQLSKGHAFELFYEPAFAPRNLADLEKRICPAGNDPFIHVDGKNYPCCMLVDTEHGKDDTLKPLSFNYKECPILNVNQAIENAEYHRVCPLVVTDAKAQKYVFPSRVEELKR